MPDAEADVEDLAGFVPARDGPHLGQLDRGARDLEGPRLAGLP